MTDPHSAEGALDLSKPMSIRANMARLGIAPMQSRPYDDPERGYVDPLDDHESRLLLRAFLGELWRACEQAEATRLDDATVEAPRRRVPKFMELHRAGHGWRCKGCGDLIALVETQADLEAMEADDPALAEAGRRGEESFARFLAERDAEPVPVVEPPTDSAFTRCPFCSYILPPGSIIGARFDPAGPPL